MLRTLRVPLLLTAVALVPWACSSLNFVPCGQIPMGGCPVESGGTCQDPTCAVLYECDNGNGMWVATQSCPPQGNTGGGGGAGEGGGGGAMPDGGACTPPPIDLGPDAGLSEGCSVDLECPDCPIAAAEPCEQQACLTGCSDFYICTNNAAECAPGAPPCWAEVAYCDANDDFVVIPPP